MKRSVYYPVRTGKFTCMRTDSMLPGSGSPRFQHDYSLFFCYFLCLLQKNLTIIDRFSVYGNTINFFILMKIFKKIGFIKQNLVSKSNKGPHTVACITGNTESLGTNRTTLGYKSNAAAACKRFVSMLNKYCIKTGFRKKNSKGIRAENL